MLKVALIGASGTISKSHIKALNWLKEENIAELVVCCDTHPENLDLEGVKVYTDYNEFLEKEKDNIDFVDICVPTFLHKDFSIKAMEAGIDVLCEKPMALNYEECLAMIEAKKRTGRKLMIAHCQRWNLSYVRLKEYIDSQKFGKLSDIKFTEYTKGLPVGQDGWFRKLELSGGSLMDFHIHDIDAFIYMLGNPERLTTFGRKDEYGDFKTITTNFIFDNDVYVNFQSNWDSIRNDKDHGRGVRLNFEKGVVVLTKDGLFEIAGDEIVKKIEVEDTRSGYYREIKYFAECIVNNTEPSYCPPEESAMAIKIARAEEASANNKGEIIIF